MLPNLTACIFRFNILFITAGQIWYVRLLLLHRTARSFEDLRTVDGIILPSFVEAAKAHGLLDIENEAELCLDEQRTYCTPAELRALFVLLTIQGNATSQIVRNTLSPVCQAMYSDFVLHPSTEADVYIAYNRMLSDIWTRLGDEGTAGSKYGLPSPTEMSTFNEIELQDILFPVQAQIEWLQRQPRLSDEQQQILNEVIHAYTEKRTCQLFIDAAGGYGKTFLLKYLLAVIRSLGGRAAVCASTGLAASNYAQGMTAHSLFKIPVHDEDDESFVEHTLLHKYRGRKTYLEQLDLIGWDELPNQPRDHVEAVFHDMQDFAGKIFIGMGDFKQIPPVVKYGDRSMIVNASIRYSPLWTRFNVRRLTIPMRAASDPEYATFIEKVGNGSVDFLAQSIPHGVSLIHLPIIQCFVVQYAHDEPSLNILNFVFNNFSEPLSMATCAILATTNKQVEQWNSIVQQYVPGPPVTLTSVDRFADTDNAAHVEMIGPLSDQLLDTFTSSDVPNHKLTLKVGDVVMLMRNLNNKDGLTNNAKMIIRHIRPYSIGAQLLSTNTLHVIPRIYFKFTPKDSPFAILRKQFPLRLAYCITINRSQGQELHRTLLDLREDTFTHGQLYVALSRVRHRDNIAVLVARDQQHQLYLNERTPSATALNVVFPELLTT